MNVVGRLNKCDKNGSIMEWNVSWTEQKSKINHYTKHINHYTQQTLLATRNMTHSSFCTSMLVMSLHVTSHMDITGE